MNDEEIYDPMTGMKLWPIEDFKQPEQEPVKYTGGNGAVVPTHRVFQEWLNNPLTKALKQALDALEEINKLSVGENSISLPAEIDTAMDAIKAVLAQPEQEPVAWMDEYGDVLSASVVDGNGLRNIPLYTAPPKREWVGLTDEEITEIRLKSFDSVATNHAVYQAIEAKLREKNIEQTL
jgi:hypothetical protein